VDFSIHTNWTACLNSIDITNTGQVLWPAIWQFPAGWIFVQSHLCHLKATWALEHVRQAWEINPRKNRQVKVWQWYTHGSLAHWCSNWVMMKSMPCHLVTRLVQTKPILSNLVTYVTWFWKTDHVCTFLYFEKYRFEILKVM